VLHQVLEVHAWTGIGLVVLANVAALVVAGTSTRRARTA
jgi:hypothetical protein